MRCTDCPKISHSAWSKYMTCPKMYDYHYNERLRPKESSSALAFGVAIDTALNEMLNNYTKATCVDMAIEKFREVFKYEDLDCCEFDSRDFDISLVPESERGPNQDYNAWKSLRVKGRMLLEAYAVNILPLIEEVEHVQKELNGRPGIIDAIIKLRGYGRVIVDHKTSVRPYDVDAVANDTQLSLYCKDQGITKAAFVVLIKTIDKQAVRICKSCSFDGSLLRHKTCPNEINGTRCNGVWDEAFRPKANIQLLVDEVPETVRDLVTESICEVERAVSSNVYPRNLKACGRIYGRKCPYYDKCWSGSNDGLEYVKETKEKVNANK